MGIVIALLVHLPHAVAHEVRPAYLQIDEIGPNRYSVLWRTPLFSGMRLPVALQFPDGVRNVTTPAEHKLPDSLVERRVIEADRGLAGKRVEIAGLQATITDVLVRIQMLDGVHSTTLVRPSQPWIDVPASQGVVEIAFTYIKHGVEHILFGFDHLLFVLALILIVRSTRELLVTVTAFTIAHSITLALATLGVVHVPRPPVEAAIALSIVLVASEILRLNQGQPGLTARWPWAVAFCFGLLHGFGFASALTDLGLPQGDIPLALFSFNVGVEIGQLIFVAVVFAMLMLVQRFRLPPTVRRYAAPTTSYAIGILATFWFFERVSAFWS